MAGSRSSCGSARHLGHMVAPRRKRKQSSASITASRRCSRATPLTISRCGHVTALISGPRALTGSLRLFPQSRDRLEQVAIPPSPTAAARNSTHLDISEIQLGTADLVYLAVDWVDCNADD